MYSKFALYYDKLGWDRYSYRFFYALLPLLKENGGGRSLLDLGCGTGTLAKEAAKNGFLVDGVDICEEMIAVAESKNRPGRSNFYVGDLCAFSVPRKYHLITSSYTLDHLLTSDHLYTAFLNVKRHLKEGGCFTFDLKDKRSKGDNRDYRGFRVQARDYLIVRRNFVDNLNGLVTKKLFLSVKNDSQRYVTIRGSLKERGYTKEEVKEVLFQAGFSEAHVLDLEGIEPKNDGEKRIFWQVM